MKKKTIPPLYSDIAYDDAFRTMESKCDDILLPFINYVFKEHYDNSATITRLRNEQFSEKDDHSRKKRITDSFFEVTYNEMTKKYHLECESRPYDRRILVRIVEYDAQIAIDNSEGTDEIIKIRFPKTALILLRNRKNTPDRAVIRFETPGGNIEYKVPIIKESDFTIEKIFGERLYLLLPFYMFNYEKNFKAINESPQRLNEISKLYKDMLIRLEHEVEIGRLSAQSCHVIINVTHSVIYKLTHKYDSLKKEVDNIMGGKVLDFSETAYFNKGVSVGIEQERANTEKERRRAEKAEREVMELRNKIAELTNS